MSDPQAVAPPVALVAGGSRGLGLLVARELGERGHRVVVCARDEVGLRRAESTLRGWGHDVQTRVCDVADADRVRTVVAEVEESVGPVEVLVCVAGVIQVGPLDALDLSHFHTAVDIMLWGPVHTALAVLPAMRARGRGRIGIISSVGGLVAVPHLLPYSTAKFGAVGFARGLRAELAGTGVTVTTVTPGLMRTGSHLRARFVGDHGREYAWFATGASLPLVSMDADRAATLIVESVLAGRAALVLTPLAKLGMWVQGLFPTLTAGALGVMARLLPSAPPPGDGLTLDGDEARRRLHRGRGLVDRLTVLGNRAATRNLER